MFVIYWMKKEVARFVHFSVVCYTCWNVFRKEIINKCYSVIPYLSIYPSIYLSTYINMDIYRYFHIKWMKNTQIVTVVITARQGYRSFKFFLLSLWRFLWFFFFLFKDFIYFIFRERKGRRKRGRETSMCCCLSNAPFWGPGDNPGVCPDWELNWQPFDLQASIQSTEPHQPEPLVIFF